MIFRAGKMKMSDQGEIPRRRELTLRQRLYGRGFAVYQKPSSNWRRITGPIIDREN